jgi:hypothetical protein
MYSSIGVLWAPHGPQDTFLDSSYGPKVSFGRPIRQLFLADSPPVGRVGRWLGDEGLGDVAPLFSIQYTVVIRFLWLTKVVAIHEKQERMSRDIGPLTLSTA